MAEVDIQEPQPGTETLEAPPQLDEEQLEMIAQGKLKLQQELDQDADLMTEIEAVLGEHLHAALSPATLQTISEGLELYLDPPGAQYLLALLLNSDDARYREAAKAGASPRTWRALRRLLALYGSSMREANSLVNVNEQGWKAMNRHVYYDVLAGRWSIALEILKTNNDRLYLDETPDSILTLANGILDTLTSVPEYVAPQLFSADTIKQLTELSERLMGLYTQHETIEQGEAGSTEATAA